MIGGLVEEQDVGRGRQHPRERRAPCFAAGKSRWVLVAGEAELLEQILRLMRVVARRQAGAHIGERGRMAGEVRFLRQVAQRGARLHETRAAVRLDQSGRDLQQCRLARPIAADEAGALAGRHRQFDAFEQRRAPEGERNIGELNEWWGH